MNLDGIVNDKVLHLLTFFLLTIVFYWILDTNRRRALNLALIVCTIGLGIGSEFVQSLLPNDRNFDAFDIVANIVGSLAGLGLCSWYHKRMMDRKRQRKQYNAVPGDDTGEDIELGEGSGIGGGEHEEGITDSQRPASVERSGVSEDDVGNWDEHNADAWNEGDVTDAGASKNAP